jgi:hypothetical protein
MVRGGEFVLDDAELRADVGDGSVEERETAARLRAKELRAEAERVPAELADAERVLEAPGDCP